MLRTILLSAAIAWPACAAHAQDCDNPVFAVREDGTPLYYHPDPQTYQRILNYVVPRAGAKADQPLDRPIVAIDLRKGRAGWISRDELDDIREDFEISPADALVYKGPDHCRPRDISWSVDDPANPGRGPIPLPEGRPVAEPIDLFPDERTDRGPRSGLWRAEIGPTRMEGCPAMMRDAFPASPGALPGMTGGSRRMDFSVPFHPDALELSRTAGVRWQEAGEGRWITTDLAAESFAQIPSGQGGGSQIVLTLTVVSPEEISFRRAIEIVLPAEVAAIMGVPPEGCRVTGTDSWIRIGD